MATAKAKKKTVENEAVTAQSEAIPFAAETGRVLQLMIHSLYTNKDIFLRELISNASDACDKLRYLSLTEEGLLGDEPLQISLKFDKATNTLEISDNGIGMNRDDLMANLGTIARSGTLEFIKQLSGDNKKDASLIGQFGVGFYSAFMVADKVVVTSKRAGEAHAWRWESDGMTGYHVEAIEDGASHPRGTSITLYLKDDAKGYADQFKLRYIVETYSDHISFPILLQVEGDEEPEIINTASALWTRPASEISQEQYQEFYHHVAHTPDVPFMTLHNKAEGATSYTNLLFIPAMKPFDLFHPERRRRVKLYVKRVFITDENVDIIPHNLRFLRGVIDSEDLPLNISRETLQDNPMMKKIRDAITAKVLGELKKKAKKDEEGYKEFWANFGAVLKEGLCEHITDKERIRLLECCRFYSTHDANALVSLEDYVARMKPEQKEIYFLSGDNLDVLKSNPQLEGFRSRGIEVLLLVDHVDDFWVNTVRNYNSFDLISVTRSKTDLDTIAKADKADKSDAPVKENSAEEADDVANLVSLLKASLREQGIKDVRTTAKLTETPACLAVGEGDMDMRMERFLMEHRQLPKRAEKILEINPTHSLILLIAKKARTEGASEGVLDAAKLLLDQARIIEGETIDDAAGFARRLASFMQRGMAA